LQPSQLPGVVGQRVQELWSNLEHEADGLAHAVLETPISHRLAMLNRDVLDWTEVHMPEIAGDLHLSGALNPAEPEWVRIARREAGEKREPGFDKNNPRILQYLATFPELKKDKSGFKGLSAADVDETPWCACFVNWCLLKAGLRAGPSPTAKSWLSYGEKLEEPRLGAITILHHTPGKSTSGTTSSGNHVAFYLSGGESRITLLGGNQSHSVCEKTFKGWDILGYRWPETKTRK